MRTGIVSVLAGVFLAFVTVAGAQEARQIITTQDADYFGFDLRSEQNLTLDQCRSSCLSDTQCRAFTYNVKAKWCFLKSDFATIKPFAGAVAGKVVPVSGDPDIGAAPALSYFPAWMASEAAAMRKKITNGSVAVGEHGLAALVKGGEIALQNGDPRNAVNIFTSAVATSPDEGALWLSLARAIMDVEGISYSETASLKSDATSAAYNGYLLLRTAPARAASLALLARGLDRRDLYRPALQAYEASLSLANVASVRARYEDLKARKGFRVIQHTVEADSASPRICAQFSEDLVKAGVDYTTFVTVDDAAPKGLEAEGRQICVEGLQHGNQYRVAFRPGLPAAIGEVLESPVVLSAYVQDRAATARFTGDSFVLPSTARRGIPVVTVNMDVADMKLFRVGDRSLAQLLSGYNFLRQLDNYDLSNVTDQLGAPVWEGELLVSGELNKEVTTSFPVDEALPDRKPGVYILTAQPKDDRTDSWVPRATQWFVVSDIGLTTYTGQDGLNVFARSLASAKPIANAEITLLARNNEILGTGKTNAEGRVTLNPGLTRGEGAMAPAVLMASGADDDFVFLDMTRAGFDLSDRGVEGRPAPGALDIYAWTERGIYRAGETVHVAALARNDAADAVENLPLTFIFSRPDGVEDRRLVSDGGQAGGHAVRLGLSSAAMRGTWSVAIHTDPKQPAIASQNFLVEDFVPDRIEFDMTSNKPEIALHETASIEVDGRFLYGAPATGLALEGELTLSTKREWAAFKGYYFGLADEENAQSSRTPLQGLPVIGDDGLASFPITVEQVPSTTRLINAAVNLRMREAGGRAVERSLDIAIRPSADMIGIRPDFSGGEVPQGGTAKFSVIAVDPSGDRITVDGALWKLVKIERNYQWYRSGNYWNYEPVTFTKSVASGTIDIAASSEVSLSQAVDWGRYRLEIETPDPSGPMTSYEFDAGWYVAATSTETPDGLEIALDKEAYVPGEVAKLKVSPRFAGELLVTIGAEKLITTISATVPEGGATLDIPVGNEWGAGAYVTATLFRPGDAQESRMPARAIGVKWLKVEPGQRKLAVATSAPEKSEPRSTLSIPVSVEGAAPGSDAYVMVAAVDVGILNLTRYQAPDPEGWFFGQRRMGLELRDLYGRLIDGSLGATGRIRTGGDGAGLVAQGEPPTEKLVAFFSGPVRLDAEGNAIVSFDIPQFNGTVRIMTVAWTKEAVGNSLQDVIIRDPVVVTAALPRFMSPEDEALMRLDIANTDGPDGQYALAIDTDGEVSVGAMPETVELTGGKRVTLTVPLTAQSVGSSGLTVRLTHADGLAVEQALSLPVRPAAIPMTTRLVVDLGPKGSSLRVDRELLAASLLEGATVSVGVSQSAAFDVPSMLMTLDKYPYGCAEQTTSRALPLLYVSELATGAGMQDEPELKERIQEAIWRVLNNQSSSGSFGLWGPGYGDLWLDAYVSDFLTRAREKGYEVPAQAMNQALANLQNAMSYDVDIEERGSGIAYALYVLARNKRASVGDLRYYSDTKLEAFSSPMAVAQLAASLALYGDAQRSEAAFSAALRLAKATPDFDWSRSDYGSKLRDGAALLALAAESRPVPSVVPELIKLVSAERDQVRWTSTQDEAWMLLAARALQEGNAALQLTVDGQPYTGAFSRTVSGEQLLETPIIVGNAGSSPIQAVVTAVAAPAQPLPAGGEGFSISRAYYRMDGSEANVTEVTQNERFVVVLRITEDNSWPSRVLVNDLLPAGFEIDNPRLVSSADLANFGWLERTEAAHLEFRDDRFIAAFDRTSNSDRNITLAYVVRAVTPGVFSHPAANVEDMYRPQYSARTASGIMAVNTP